jgi:hypothetical protein
MSVSVAVVEGPGEGGERQIGADGVVVGREEGSAIVIADAEVSRRHARIRLDEDGGAVVDDLGSANGTFVNGERLRETRTLFDGDRITVGGATLEVRGGSEAPTDVLGGAAPATERSELPPPPPRRRRPAPRPAAAEPREPDGPATIADGFNYAAVAAIILGPLSILFVLTGTGAAFYASLPIGIAGIAAGSAGKRSVDSGRASGLRSVALAGQVFAVVGVVLSTLLIALLLIFNQIVGAGADSLEGLIDEVRSEIEGVPLPENLQN